MKGNLTSTWNVQGACLTAQSILFLNNAYPLNNITYAEWRVCWKPNITNGAQTALRLVSADSGPSNISPVIATFSGGKPNSPLNEAFDITAALQALINSHCPANEMFQFFTQSVGDGSNAALIYKSSLYVVYENNC